MYDLITVYKFLLSTARKIGGEWSENISDISLLRGK